MPTTGTKSSQGRHAGASGEEGGRDRIIRAAARLFREKGFRAATVRELAEAAGMQSGSLFYFFPSKQDILLAVMGQGMAEVHAAVAAAREGLEPVAAFRAMVRQHLEGILQKDPDHMAVMLYETRSLPAGAGKQVLQLRREYEEMWEAQITALIHDGHWRLPEEPRLSRLALMGALNWSVQWFRPQRGDTPARLAETLCALFLQEPA